MADEPRKRPYVWVSWLTKLLAGEESCWYKGWYKAHHRYEKTADDAERADFFAEWTAKHDAIVRDRAHELRAEGHVVRVEDDASFKLKGTAADLAGKPDLVAIKDGTALVVDGKAGRRRESDHWQVLIYLFALPLSWLAGAGLKIIGRVAYQDGDEPVRALGSKEHDAITSAIRRVAAVEAPAASPSAWECKRCDVAGCAFRHAVPEGDARRFF